MLSYFLRYFPLIISDAISKPLHNLNTVWYMIMILEYPLVYDHDASQLCRTSLDDVLRTRMTTPVSILSELFPLDGFRCNFVSAL